MTVSKSVNLKQYFYDKTDADAKFATKEELPTAYTHPTHTAAASGLYKITVDSLGHVSATTAVTASDLPAHTHSDYEITVEKQGTAETGYAHTYVIKQNNVQVGQKINIPKDFLVKSATLETCATANSPQNGLAVGDKYIDFVVNTTDNTGTDQHIYLNVKDLVDVYTADESTLTLSNGVFSIKSGVIPVGEDTASNILGDGTASAGVSTKFARADHVHPADDTKANVADLGLSYDPATGVLSLITGDEVSGPQPYTLNQDPANVISGSITFTDGE